MQQSCMGHVMTDVLGARIQILISDETVTMTS